MSKKFEIYDYLVLVSILSFSIFIGVYHGFKLKLIKIWRKLINKTNENKVEADIELEENITQKDDDDTNKVSEYLTANSTLGSVPIAFSLLASFYSATALLGMPAEMYVYGTEWYLVVIGMMITPLIGCFVTGPLFAKLNISSVFEYLEFRFNSRKVRQTGTVCYIVRTFLSAAIFMYGPATSLSILTNLDEKIAIFLVGIVGTFYTTVGGLKAVIWTDVFQASVMILSSIIIIVKGLGDAGGLERVWQINADGGRLNWLNFDPDPFIRQSTWSIVLGMIVYFSISYAFDQQMIQRFQAAKTKKIAQRALLLNIPGIFVMVSLCCFPGLIIYAIYHKCDPLSNPYDKVGNPNQLIVYFVMNNTSVLTGFQGLFLAALFCGSLSSLSSCLNSQACIIYSDFLKHLDYFSKFNDSKSLRTNQILVFLCGLISTGLSFLISTIGGNLTQISTSLNGAFNAPIIGLFLLGLLFKNTNKYGAIVGTIFGFLAGVWISIGSYIIKPVYPKLPMSIEYCNLTLDTQLNVTDSIYLTTFLPSFKNAKMLDEVTGFKRFYYMSYMWYTTWGVIVTLFVGIIVSIITGGNKATYNKSLVLFDSFYLCSLAKKKFFKSKEEIF